jgi:2-polyprenyl-3-methyl-5-hydroxy-6-metoxy-1,4-benzoquinol methylase
MLVDEPIVDCDDTTIHAEARSAQWDNEPRIDRVPVSSAGASLPQTYWNTAAETYEHDFTETLVGKLWRDSVWRELDAGFLPSERVLELNCGTGIDALHLASRGVSVVACDISSRMIEFARHRASDTGFADLVDFHILPTEQLASLQTKGLFDGAFSNFSGLNCVKDLSQVRDDLASLLKPGSRVFLCMLGRFMPWEILRYGAQGMWKKAFQKLRRDWIQVTESGVEVRLHSRKEIAELFAPDFRLRSWKGIGITVPPSYMDRWAHNFPMTMKCLSGVDRVISRVPILRNWGGCILFEFERTIP